MRRAFLDVIGNEPLREQLAHDIAGNTLSHAYLLEGDTGTGKHTLALRIAAALACERREDADAPIPCGSCPSCRKILSGNSPDVIYVNRGEKATLGVDEIRAVTQDVYVAPNDVATKTYVIEDAHLMTEQAQNALLLTLEEPPAYVLFLLLCQSVTPLLETIRSRAPTLRLSRLDPAQIDSYLTAHSTDAAQLKKTAPAEYAELLVAAEGSIGRALSLLDARGRRAILGKRANARTFAKLCAKRKNSAETLRFLNSLGQKRDDLTEQFNVMLLCLRDLIAVKLADAPPLCFFADVEEANELAYAFTTPELLSLYHSLGEASESLRMNANIRLTLTSLAVNAKLL